MSDKNKNKQPTKRKITDRKRRVLLPEPLIENEQDKPDVQDEDNEGNPAGQGNKGEDEVKQAGRDTPG